MIPDGFKRTVGYSGRIECETCGAKGMPGGDWMKSHLRGHPFVCDECGKALSTGQGLAGHKRTHWPEDRKRANGYKISQGSLAYWRKRRKEKGL